MRFTVRAEVVVTAWLVVRVEFRSTYVTTGDAGVTLTSALTKDDGYILAVTGVSEDSCSPAAVTTHLAIAEVR